MRFKLGRKAVKTDPRTLRLENYLSTSLVPPASMDWTKGITSWGMMDNDTYGCCVIAGVGHAVQVWSANDASEITEPDKQILEQYGYWCGFNPNDAAATDNGCIELDVLNRWKKYTFCGKQLKAFVSVAPSNMTGIKNAIALFGGVFIGLSVPNYVMNSLTTAGSTWGIQPDDGIAGGHCVYVVGYDASTLTFISWGGVYKMTWAFWNKYVDECYCLLGQNWVEGKSPTGLNLTQLEADLAAI